DRCVATLVARLIAGPQPRDDLDAVVHQTGSLDIVTRLATERRELPPEVDAQADAQHDASAAQMIERHRFARDLPRPSPSERGDEGTEAYRRGRRGDGAQRDPRIDERDRDLVLDVVPQEESVPTSLLRRNGQIDERVHITERTDRWQ